jgi:hypothetical protein
MTDTTTASKREAYWVRVTYPDGAQTLWCINTGKTRWRQVIKREVAKGAGHVEWGIGEGHVGYQGS